MKKLLKSITAAFLAATTLLCVSSCKKNPADSSADDKPTTTIKVMISSDEISAASEDSAVKAAIEKKFYEDTGEKINLQVTVYTNKDFTTAMSTQMTTKNWDAAVDYIGQAGIETLMFEQNVCLDLADMIDEDYPELKTFFGEEAFGAVTDTLGIVYGIPSLSETKNTGLMIRKDYMEAVGYTTEEGHNDDLGAVNEAAGTRKKTLVTIADLQDMMQRMVAQNICKSPLIGMPWDVESMITVGPFGESNYANYARIDNEDGSLKEIVPGNLTEAYKESLHYEYYWENTGLWEADSYTKPKTNRLNDYVNGNGALYVVDPKVTNLIKVSRQVKAHNPSATFTFLNPLKGVDSSGNATEKSGFHEKQTATDCLAINKSTPNADMVLKYISWLTSSRENYELAKYGVKNTHWIDAGEGFYTYPADKAEKYVLDPPYSGIYSLIDLDAKWGRIYGDYTDEEKGWIDLCKNAPRYKSATANMLFLGLDDDTALNRDSAGNSFFNDVTYAAWTGAADSYKTFSSAERIYRNTAATYINFLTDRYKIYAQLRGIKTDATKS